MEVIDYFSGDGFTIASMTDAISHVDFKPDFLGSIGLYEPEGVPTRTVIIEEESQELKLVPTSQYGGPSTPRGQQSKRKDRSFVVPHLSTEANITAEEIQGVRAYANGMKPQQVLLAVEELRNRKLSAMRDDLEATFEYQRVSALKGILVDADGSAVIYNWFTEFGVSQQTLGMALTTDTTDVAGKVRQAIRLSLTALKNQKVTGWRAICGDNFFDALVGHKKVEDKYLNWTAAANLSDENRAYGTFEHLRVRWTNYRGSVTGSDGAAKDFVGADDAYLFPEGVKGLFLWKNGPADLLDRVNQIPSPNGLPIEVYSAVKDGKRVYMEAQSNPLFMCTKPRAVIKLTKV